MIIKIFFRRGILWLLVGLICLLVFNFPPAIEKFPLSTAALRLIRTYPASSRFLLPAEVLPVPSDCDSDTSQINRAENKRTFSKNIRLVRFISIRCEMRDQIIRRFERSSRNGLPHTILDQFYVSDLYQQLGDTASAKKLRQENINIAYLYQTIGVNAVDNFHNDGLAKTFFALALQTDPDFKVEKADLYRYLCLFTLKSGHVNDNEHSACADFYQAKRSPLASILLGRYAYLQRNFSDAMVALREAIQMDPGMGDAYYWLGRSYLCSQSYPDAEAAFARGIQNSPHYALNYLDLAKLSYFLEKYDQGDRYLSLIPNADITQDIHDSIKVIEEQKMNKNYLLGDCP